MVLLDVSFPFLPDNDDHCLLSSFLMSDVPSPMKQRRLLMMMSLWSWCRVLCSWLFVLYRDGLEPQNVAVPWWISDVQGWEEEANLSIRCGWWFSHIRCVFAPICLFFPLSLSICFFLFFFSFFLSLSVARAERNTRVGKTAEAGPCRPPAQHSQFWVSGVCSKRGEYTGAYRLQTPQNSEDHLFFRKCFG